MPGAIQLPHTCPRCNTTTARTHQELQERFGFRNLNPNNDPNPTKTTNQSWCRQCRSRHS